MLGNIFRLGIKELRSLFADRMLLIIIVWAFTAGIYAAATGMSRELHNAPVAVVDFDQSALTDRIVTGLRAPWFLPPRQSTLSEMDTLLDRGEVSFAIVFPEHFQRDFAAGKRPAVQVNIDATNMGQSFIGASYISNIITEELQYEAGIRSTQLPLDLVTRVRFNPNLNGLWFGGVMEVINNITLLSIVLVGAAFIREREHGTLEHLLVMPLSAFEIMAGKVWANALVVLIAATLSLRLIVQLLMDIPLAGSVSLFIAGAALYLFSTASIGIFLGTLARSMPQFGLLIILVILPLQLLSGGVTPRESMPQLVQQIMEVAPTPHFISFAQAVLFRGAGIDLVWPQLLRVAGIGVVFFVIALARLRKTVAQTQ
ncbi:MAG: ABC transporter permease [Rhodocyclaceae bacterium]